MRWELREKPQGGLKADKVRLYNSRALPLLLHSNTVNSVYAEREQGSASTPCATNYDNKKDTCRRTLNENRNSTRPQNRAGDCKRFSGKPRPLRRCVPSVFCGCGVRLYGAGNARPVSNKTSARRKKQPNKRHNRRGGRGVF